ncbi:hypothetical protein AURDEDRAFT_174326 [Auricularia subglabra TFB-10046 SS5]|nr:hypothetical protein AURDEDRAFT_174326 [Auricularia subglabra TFB-10046 SS5]
MEMMELRTGVKAFFVAVRSSQLQPIQPFYACSPDIMQFFNIVLGMTLDQIIGMFEMWAIGGVQGALGINTKSVGDTKKDVRRVIQNGYTQVLAKRYPARVPPPQEVMNYQSYDTAVVKKHGVRLIGWTYNNGKVCQPGNITPGAEVRKLYLALITEECHWELVPEDEWDPSEHMAKKRKKRSDADQPRKKRKTGPATSTSASASAGPKAKKTSGKKGKAAPDSVDDESEEVEDDEDEDDEEEDDEDDDKSEEDESEED